MVSAYICSSSPVCAGDSVLNVFYGELNLTKIEVGIGGIDKLNAVLRFQLIFAIQHMSVCDPQTKRALLEHWEAQLDSGRLGPYSRTMPRALWQS